MWERGAEWTAAWTKHHIPSTVTKAFSIYNSETDTAKAKKLGKAGLLLPF